MSKIEDSTKRQEGADRAKSDRWDGDRSRDREPREREMQDRDRDRDRQRDRYGDRDRHGANREQDSRGRRGDEERGDRRASAWGQRDESGRGGESSQHDSNRHSGYRQSQTDRQLRGGTNPNGNRYFDNSNNRDRDSHNPRNGFSNRGEHHDGFNRHRGGTFSRNIDTRAHHDNHRRSGFGDRRQGDNRGKVEEENEERDTTFDYVVPRGGQYFEHDDRDLIKDRPTHRSNRGFGGHRQRHEHQNSSNRSLPPQNAEFSSKVTGVKRGASPSFWRHDRFEEVQQPPNNKRPRHFRNNFNRNRTDMPHQQQQNQNATDNTVVAGKQEDQQQQQQQQDQQQQQEEISSETISGEEKKPERRRGESHNDSDEDDDNDYEKEATEMQE